MTNKHTKGPWVAVKEKEEDGDGFEVMSGKYYITSTHHFAYGEHNAEDNARLIAAAPELYECLRQIISDLPFRRDWLDPVLEQAAKDAIAKATGADQIKGGE